MNVGSLAAFRLSEEDRRRSEEADKNDTEEVRGFCKVKGAN
jgi:hypothetical protein